MNQSDNAGIMSSNNNLMLKLGYVPNGKPTIKEVEKRPIRAVTYIRVSTEDQADPVKGSLDEQLRKCLEAIERHGWEHVRDYSDVQKGHTIDAREDLSRLLDDAARKKDFDVVIDYDTDRFSRDSNTANNIRFKLKWNFIQVYSVNQPREIVDPDIYDPDRDESGVIHDAMADVKSDLDVKRLRKKVRQGARTRALRGEPHDVPYGYGKNLVRNNPVVFDIFQIEVEAAVVIKIYNYYVKEEYSLRRICTTLNQEKIFSPMGKLWTPATVRKILSNPFYIGIVRHNHRPVFRRKRVQTPPEEWILTPSDKIPKLIDGEIFKQAQERIRKRFILHGRAVASEGLFVGIGYCHCGHKLHYKRRNISLSMRKRSPNARDRWYYLCSCNNRHGNIKVCPCKIYKIAASRLDDIVLQRIRELSLTSQTTESFNQFTLIKLTENLELQIQSAKNRKKELGIERMRWDAAYGGGYITPEKYGELAKNVEDREKIVDAEFTGLTSALLKAKSDVGLLEKKRYYLSKFIEIYEKGDLSQKKKFLQEIIKKVVVGNNGEVYIEFILDDVLYENYDNPHPCGYYGSQKKQCTCLPGSISRYRKKLSGPILDRIDLHVEVPEVKLRKLTAQNLDGERSDVIRKRVQAACARQKSRFHNGKLISNAEMNSKDVRELCVLDATCKSLLTSATAQMGLTARSYFKIIKIARTIADLSGEKDIAANHLAEALQYRPKDMEL